MIHSTGNSFSSFPYPSQVKRIVFSDFDETYMPFLAENKEKSGIPELEKFLKQNISSLSLLIGWISGSNPAALLRKSAGYVNFLPHFIAGSLGSELYWVRNGQPEESLEWKEHVYQTGFRKENTYAIIKRLKEKGVPLDRQAEDYQGIYKETFYYRISPRLKEDRMLMETIATEYGIKVLFSRCNPTAGDPADCYDVDLLPACCGKGEMAAFISKLMNVEKENRWAFGDSFNDFGMFDNCDNHYLVANADPEAKKIHSAITNSGYCNGILEILQKLV